MHIRALASASLAVIAFATPAMGNPDVLQQTAKPEQWVLQTGDYANQRYSKLDQINRDNVRNLKVAWTFSTGVLRGHEGSPLVIGSTMYVHTPFPNIVYALDLNDDGKILWKYEPKQDPSVIPVMCCDTVYRGVAYADGTIYHHQADTTLVALDAKTGKEKWKVVNGDPKKGETNTATVLPVKDKIIVGISGAEFGVRGHVTAYDAKTGKQVWRAYSLGPDNEMLFDPDKTMSLGKPVGKDSSLRTWNGDQWRIGGGTAWGWFSYDPETNLFYYGTANPSTWNPVQRAGPDGKPIDQKWTMAIIARDADTGMARWAYQMTPFDEWDYDGVNEMILADINIAGQQRKVLVHFDRNGLGYTLDRVTGELLVAEQVRPEGQLDHRCRDGQEQPAVRASTGREGVLHLPDRSGQEHQGCLPGSARQQGPAARGLLATDQSVLRADESRLYGLRAVQGLVHSGSALCRGDAVDVPGARQSRRHRRLHRLGCGPG